MYNENNDPILENTPSPEAPVTENAKEQSAPATFERNEIIYNADKKSDEYNVNYITTTKKVKKPKAPRPKGYGIKVAAVIIAAIFTLTLCAFMGTYIYKNLTAILSSDVISNLSEKLDIPLGVDKGVFQMEIPESDGKVQTEHMISVKDVTGALSVNEIA